MGVVRTYRRLRYLRRLAGTRRGAIGVYLRDLIYVRSLTTGGGVYRRLLWMTTAYSMLRSFFGRTPEELGVERLEPGQSVTVTSLGPARGPARGPAKRRSGRAR